MAGMFTVGEFSQLAQVSKRLLRYYDEIGLLKPAYTDKFTHRRYYRAEQLPRLNRILALKDLGLSLDQIQRLLSDQVSTDEMQGMLLLKKAEIEQQLQGELQRIRNIESRLQFIRDAEANKPLDVVVKHIPAQPVLSVRTVFPSTEVAMSLFGQIVTVKTHVPVPLNSDLCLTVRELPAVETMATFVVKGATENMHIGYSAIGTWAETNGYRFAGAPREIALQMPKVADGSDGITEIQFPVEPVRQTDH
jgi:DNA-binding transcriptional MerR regulator